jgi:hypothetical protein
MKNDEFSSLRKALREQSEVVEDCCGNCVWLQCRDMTCHRMPPITIKTQEVVTRLTVRDGVAMPYGSGSLFGAVWPKVDKDDWCGEFESGDQD